jgi:hypothetical protein
MGEVKDMKKRTIFIGSIFTIFLMMMIPNISAVEYQTVINKIENNLKNVINDSPFDMDVLNEKMKRSNIQELINKENVPEEFKILQWIFILAFTFFIFRNAIDGDLLNTMIAIFGLILSVLNLINSLNNPEIT